MEAVTFSYTPTNNMANKRIRALDLTTTFPEGSVIPLDAAGLNEALAIKVGDLTDAISLVLIPALVIDDPGAAQNNTDAIDAALAGYAASTNKKGILRLPRGTVYLARVIYITAAHSGLSVEGDGCILVNATYPPPTPAPKEFIVVVGYGTGEEPTGYEQEFDQNGSNTLEFVNDISASDFVVGDAMLLFKSNPSANNRVDPQQTVTITAVDVVNRLVTIAETFASNELNKAKWLYHARKLQSGTVNAGTTDLVIPGSVATLFKANTWAYVTDGVGVIELYGEYVRILNVVQGGGNTTLTLESGVRQSYISGRAAVIPGGRWVENLTIRNLTLGGMYPHKFESTSITAKFCVNLRLEGVRNVVVDSELAGFGCLITTSQDVLVSDSHFIQGKGFLFGATRDAVVERSRVWVDNEEFASDIIYRDCDIVG